MNTKTLPSQDKYLQFTEEMCVEYTQKSIKYHKTDDFKKVLVPTTEKNQLLNSKKSEINHSDLSCVKATDHGRNQKSKNNQLAEKRKQKQIRKGLEIKEV